jgi:hypothetical protein
MQAMTVGKSMDHGDGRTTEKKGREQMELVRMATINDGITRVVALALFCYSWLHVAWMDLRGELLVRVLAGPTSGHRLASRAGAQGLVEWSLAAAVLAFVGLGAWRLAGTAITEAVNRMIGNLNQAGS